jgi:hypothetical protein
MRIVSSLTLFAESRQTNLFSFMDVGYRAPHMDTRPTGLPGTAYSSMHPPNQIAPTASLLTRTAMQNPQGLLPPQYGPYQQHAGYGIPYGSGSWSYQYGGQLPPQPVPPPAARGPPMYYQNPGPAVATPNPGQAYSYPPLAPTYRGRSQANLQWQPSYTGPRPDHSAPNQIHYYPYPPQAQTPSTTAATNTQ